MSILLQYPTLSRDVLEGQVFAREQGMIAPRNHAFDFCRQVFVEQTGSIFLVRNTRHQKIHLIALKSLHQILAGPDFDADAEPRRFLFGLDDGVGNDGER